MTHTVHGKPVAPVIGALLLAALAYALSQTVVAPALPQITDEYHTTQSSSSWVLTGYLLSASVCTPLAGKLGDLFGKGRVLTVVLTIFSLGSVVCGLADSVGVLIAGRVVQGVAGGVFPLAFGIVNDELPADKRATAIGLISAMFGIGGGIGLPLSGLIVDHLHLSLLFWIGLMALPAAVAVWFYVPPSPARERTRVDWRGAAVLSGGLVALLLGITKANQLGWGSATVVGLLLGGVAILAAFVPLQLRTEQPLVDIRVLNRRPVLATNVTGFLVGVAMFGSFLLIPQFAQAAKSTGYGFGFSVTGAGLVMLPSAVTMLFAGPIGGMLGNRFGFRAVLAAGTVLAGSSFALLAFAHAHVWEFVIAGVLLGAGISFSFAAMANLIVDAVDRHDVGIATGINTIARTVGGAFGSAIVTVILTADTIGNSRTATETAYTDAFALSAGVALLALGASLAIPRVVRARRERELSPQPA
ncbi:MAG TPA: MFS transporter [Solirubrobacteraceae bacterium]|jgi:EmrB/QacA subfamily drug resistance transporter